MDIVTRPATPEDIALAAVREAGWKDFRHLAMYVAEHDMLRKHPSEVAPAVNLSPDVWQHLQHLDAYRQEQTIAIIYKHAAQPQTIAQVIGQLVATAVSPEKEENGLAAHRIYFGLLSRIGALPKEEVRATVGGMQVNILMAQPREVVVIGDEANPVPALEKAEDN